MAGPSSSFARFVSRVTAWALARKPVRAVLLYVGARGPALADSVTYRTLFSVFAGVLLGFSLAAMWLSESAEAWQALIDAVNSAIPGLVGADGLVQVSQIEAPAGVSIAGVISTVILLAAAIGSVGSLRVALRTIAGRTTDDSVIVWVLLRNLLLAIGIGAGLVAAAAATLLTTAGIDLVRDWLGVAAGEEWNSALAWLVSVLVIFALDTVVVAASFFLLSGIRPRAKTLWSGAALGGAGLVVLQQLSGLFVRGADNNPLLASFASLIALLIWLNFSTHVILLASAYIVTGHEEDTDRVRARHGAATFAQYRLQRAQIAVRAAMEELRAAREAEEEERESALETAGRSDGPAHDAAEGRSTP